ncbi:MAG TPA: outer membrane lipoprotein-sorting protein [Desulfomonilia bacterium]|nr:outer membrane lipoprotein-sorting protein [Deltaproteobacteria bacterium]HPD22020.1 outer membrane lipoprotein-sorting protein [Deltaproteobacteria bacterium]HRS56485.1 outer membrane lipoprotein-sorting protein [Desulfomonilia bacterium]HRV35760.1 outer membrane lipoprotein-sorting protein [Desulfomonilia bacterium]
MKLSVVTASVWALLAAGALVLTGQATALSAEMSAYDIVKKSEELTDQANDSTAEMTMILVNDKGQKRERKLSAFVKKYGEDSSKSILFFDSPADVKGTSFLVWTENKEDKQWLYLPALQRVRQISASGKGESFMGTELTFFDMGSHDVDDYTFTMLGEEPIDGEDCYKIEALPKEVEFYSKIVFWIRKGNFIPARADFYDPKGRYEKRGTFTKVKDIQGINTPTHIEMHNVQNNRTTIIELGNVVYDSGLKDDIFTERYMKRGK